MKKLIILILVNLLFSCKPTSEQAAKYNDELIKIIDMATGAQNNFLEQTDGHNLDSLKFMYKLFCDKTIEAKNLLNEKNAIFDKSTEYADAAKIYISDISKLATNEGKVLVNLIVNDSTDITEEEASRIQKIAEEYDAKYKKAYDEINAAQKVFSKKYGFILMDDTDKK